MDDFLPDMFESLQEIDQANEKKKNHGTSFFAEALIPVNPVYWPAYYAGSAFRDEGPELNDKLNRFASNLERMEDYLVTSNSDVQYRDRAWTVAGDTAKVNLMCEVYGQLGAFVSGHYANKSGVMKSPGYPYDYQDEKECVYTITAEENYIIKIEIMEFDLEYSGDCGNDALEFRDGDSEFSPPLRTFCGNHSNIPIKILFTKQSKIWIR